MYVYKTVCIFVCLCLYVVVVVLFCFRFLFRCLCGCVTLSVESRLCVGGFKGGCCVLIDHNTDFQSAYARCLAGLISTRQVLHFHEYKTHCIVILEFLLAEMSRLHYPKKQTGRAFMPEILFLMQKNAFSITGLVCDLTAIAYILKPVS